MDWQQDTELRAKAAACEAIKARIARDAALAEVDRLRGLMGLIEMLFVGPDIAESVEECPNLMLRALLQRIPLVCRERVAGGRSVDSYLLDPVSKIIFQRVQQAAETGCELFDPPAVKAITSAFQSLTPEDRERLKRCHAALGLTPPSF